MSLDRFARQAAFWALDWAKGRPIGNHVRDLQTAFADPEAATTRLAAAFTPFFDCACRNTEYYKQFAGVRCVRDMPVLSKRTIQAHPERFLSVEYARPSLALVRTSGSYGTPLVYYLTKRKMARRAAEVIYFGRWAGYEVGDRHVFLRVTAGNRKSPLTLFMQNEILVDAAMLNEEWLAAQLQVLWQEHVKVIIAYPSTIGPLAAYSEAQGIDPTRYGLEAIIVMSEPLHESTRISAERAFGCPVLSRYAAQEFGVLAHECLAQKRHHINVASYIVEVLGTDGDEPAPPGKPGRVVVTDPCSHAMPLIRYDTGDLAVLGSDCPCGLPGPTLEHLEGRLAEQVWAADGSLISPMAPTGVRKGVEGVLQYQFAQLADGVYEMRLHVLPSFNGEDIMRQRLAAVLGPAADIRFRYVDQIAPLPSGKRPVVVNEMRHKETGMFLAQR